MKRSCPQRREQPRQPRQPAAEGDASGWADTPSSPPPQAARQARRAFSRPPDGSPALVRRGPGPPAAANPRQRHAEQQQQPPSPAEMHRGLGSSLGGAGCRVLTRSKSRGGDAADARGSQADLLALPHLAVDAAGGGAASAVAVAPARLLAAPAAAAAASAAADLQHKPSARSAAASRLKAAAAPASADDLVPRVDVGGGKAATAAAGLPTTIQAVSDGLAAGGGAFPTLRSASTTAIPVDSPPASPRAPATAAAPPRKRSVRFAPGPLGPLSSNRTDDGHPATEGGPVVPVRRVPNTYGLDLTRGNVLMLEQLLGSESSMSLARLKRRVGLLPPARPPRPHAGSRPRASGAPAAAAGLSGDPAAADGRPPARGRAGRAR